MPSMWSHDRSEGWAALTSDDEDNEMGLDELARFIAENDTDATSDSQGWRSKLCCHFSMMCRCAAGFKQKFNTRICGVIVSVILLVATAGICLGIGITSMIPLPVIDISIEAFNIPNHIAYMRYNSFALALKHNVSMPRRSRRDTSSILSGALERHNIDTRDINMNFKSFEPEERLQYKPIKELRNEVDTIASRMVNEVAEKSRVKRSAHSGCIFGTQVYPRWKMQVIFLAQGDDNHNIFTKERIETVHKVEKMVLAHPQFRDFCFKDYKLGQIDPAVRAQSNCAPLNSLLTYFYPTKDTHGSIHYDGLGNNLDQVDSALKLAMNQETFYYYVDEKINRTYHHSKLLRTEVVFGAPLDGYCIGSTRGEQERKFKEFVITYIDILSKASTDKVQVLYGGNELFDYEVDMTFWNDIKMAYFTLGFIILLMFILTSFSVWLTFCGMLSIILSFPLALFFYRRIFHIDALGILNGAAAFVIIGIGVDDVFVFVNIFRQASHFKVISDQMWYTVKTAGKATFFTSATTAAAFAANIASSIPAVYEFGLFMSLIVSSCWATVILIMPPALYLWVICFSKCERLFFTLCSCRLRRRVVNPLDAQQLQQAPNTTVLNPGLDDDVPMLHIDNAVAPAPVNTIADDDGDVPMLIPDPYNIGNQSAASAADSSDSLYIGKALQLLIGKYLAKLILKGRYVIIGVFTVILIGSVCLMVQLRPATHPPQLFRPNTNLQQLLDLKANFSMLESLSCYKCSALYNVKPSKAVNPTARSPAQVPALPPKLPTADMPTGHATLRPSAPIFPPSTKGIKPSTASPKPTTTTTTTATTTTTTTTTTTHRPAFHPHFQPHYPRSDHPTTTIKPGSVSENFNACGGNKCNDLKERPNIRTGTKVYVVFGIKGLDRSNVQKGHVLSEYTGRATFDQGFSQRSMTLPVLKELCSVCKLIAANTELVKKGSAHCLPPVIPQSYIMMLQMVPECKDLPKSTSISKFQAPIQAVGGMTPNNTLLWLAFAFESTTSKGMSYFKAYKQYQKWEAFIDHIKQTKLSPDSPLKDMFQASEFWKKVMMEVVAVSSAIYGLALSMLVCIIAIAIFTGHLGLLFIVVITITAMICLVVAIFYLAGWEMGAVEAISLSILVGSSVDYCIHLVEGYIIAIKHIPEAAQMKNAEKRAWRTSFALRHIGVAIISSAITTIIAAIPLTQTTIQPFSKFGDIVLINTTVSITFTLLLCGALLTTIGPAKFKSSIKASGIALGIMTVVIGILTLILFVLSRTVVDIPGPGGNPLFPR
ncbi:protein dispatched homolog 3-like isoform X2 [Haliotis asinina]